MKHSKGSLISFKNIVLFFLCIYFSVFMIYPIIKAFSGSFHDWNPLIDEYNYVGFSNYMEILRDSVFWESISNTLFFSFFSVLFRIIFGLGLALLLHSKFIKGKSFFRGLFYMPTITPMVAISFVWMWLYNSQFGLINKIFSLDINWLNNSKYALPAIIVMTVWKDFGYATVIFLSGLMGLPEDVFEAASIDGVNAWQKFRYITVPLLKPTTIFVVITSLISYLQTYIQVLIMTKGGPGTSTNVISYLIFDEAFVKYRFGTASAMSIVLFIIIAILTGLMFKLTAERKSAKMKSAKTILLNSVLLVMAIITIIPFLWMLLSSFAPNSEIVKIGGSFIPETFTLDNYITIQDKFNFMGMFLNSLFIAVTVTIIVIYTSALIGYLFAKFDFRLKFLFGIILSTMMLPWAVTIIPKYDMMVQFNWLDSYKSLIIPSMVSAFGVFMFRQSISQISDEMIEAAKVDGAKDLYIFHRIILPMSRNTISSLAIFQFLWTWEDFLWPFLMISDEKKQLLPVGLKLFNGQYGTDYGGLFAATTISIIPVIIIYLIFQKQFISGIQSGVGK